MFKNKSNILYISILIIALVIVITNRVITGFSNILWISDFGKIFGTLYIIYAAKHNVLMYVFDISSSIMISITSFIQHIYFNAVFCMFIAAPLMFFGLLNWIKNEKNKNDDKNLKKISKKGSIYSLIVLLIVIPLIMFILWKINSNMFYLDALATSFIFLGMILASNMYIEQFLSYIVANLFLVIMYVFLTIQNINNIVYLFMYFLFFSMSIFNYFNWKKLYKKQINEKNISVKIVE